MENSIPWIEKYRPNSLQEIILDESVKLQIKFFIKNTNVHLLVTGVPGIGKTTTARCIAREVLGDNLDDCFLEVNAAEDRGARSITAIIPNFCRRKTNFGRKVVLFDEADNLTKKCQNDVNIMVKKFGDITNFIFTCNESNKISESIQSICHIMRLRKIENVAYDASGIEMLYYVSDGDMRRSINDLQKTSYTSGIVSKETVLQVCKMPDPSEIKYVLGLCESLELEKSIEIVNKMISLGFHYQDIVKAFEFVVIYEEIPEDKRIRMLQVINNARVVICSSVRSELQMYAMIARLIKLFLPK